MDGLHSTNRCVRRAEPAVWIGAVLLAMLPVAASADTFLRGAVVAGSSDETPFASACRPACEHPLRSGEARPAGVTAELGGVARPASRAAMLRPPGLPAEAGALPCRGRSRYGDGSRDGSSATLSCLLLSGATTVPTPIPTP